MTTKQQVTVLGLGPMGRALAGALLEAGHQVTIWNRTPGRGDELVARGAVEASSAAAAAGPLTILCVLDYRAAQEVAVAAGEALRGTALVNLTGGSPAQARSLRSAAAEYLDGSILAGPWTIGGPEAVLLYSGSAAAFARHEPVLSVLGAATYLGEDPGQAAAHDVAMLDFFWTSLAGMSHAFKLAAAEGIPAGSFARHLRVMAGQLPELAGIFGEQLDAGSFPGDGSDLHSSAASLDHVIAAVRARGLDTATLSATRAEVARAIEAGFGSESFARLGAPKIVGVPR